MEGKRLRRLLWWFLNIALARTDREEGEWQGRTEEESRIWDPVSLSLSAGNQLWDLGPRLSFTPANEEPAAGGTQC